MKLLAMLTMSAAVLASTTVFTNAFAQDSTRTNIDPTYQEQVVRNNTPLQDSGEGADMSGAGQSGHRAMTRNNMSNKPAPCVGPASYCNIYFGS
jgi:hypothetical protein